MDITPLIPKERLAITGYGAGYFSLNGAKMEGNITLQGGHAHPWNGEYSIEALTANIHGSIDILLIGTGTEIIPLKPELRAALKARNIAVEAMDTGAACRTYNVLLAEDRRVAVALVAV